MTIFPVQHIQRLAIKLKPAAQRMVKKGHPWVFEGGITKQSAAGKAGDLAIIYDNKKNKFLACGLYDPDSPIRIKVLQFHKSAVINSDWFEQKIQAAYQKRASLLATDTNSYRLIYGENDGLPSLVADVYKDIIVVKLYSAIWLPYLKDILPILLRISQCQTMVLRLSRSLQQVAQELGVSDGQVLYGQLKDEVVVFKEHGIAFSANVIHGHKTGYFLDHRHNRLKIGNRSKGKKVLDVFAYAGGFSVHALAKGATEVVSIDISAKALEMAQQNAALNPHTGQHITLAVDAFKGLEELIQKRKLFDIVIIDPPSFAKKETEVEGAKNSYKRLAALGCQLVKKGGLLVLASCTARIKAIDFFESVESSLKSSGRAFQIQEKTYHDVDHPIGFPEGAYLKCGYYRLQN
ncbi:class I SAM-dependent rRNA methyltransferase [Aureispira anguillae]|uniref:Class I SAM-dependent rRNA methyltransferase n=1 Tax=Aureispira anguillae TaxID=2864201 RepID=A0A915YB58_9BACT|nr:class I SAM-dependent rRNA methyltransferase [Aureispira anguillae]BDS09847.1 class I SAM-dependent rRNA methyltransferase [Aureispira anguillae]